MLRCPECGAHIARVLDWMGDKAVPGVGSKTVCVGCAEIIIWGNDGGRRMRPSEFLSMALVMQDIFWREKLACWRAGARRPVLKKHVESYRNFDRSYYRYSHDPVIPPTY